MTRDQDCSSRQAQVFNETLFSSHHPADTEILPNAGWLRLTGIIAGLASIGAMFTSWMTFDIPLKTGTINLYPWVFVGGRIFTVIYCLIVFLGAAIFATSKPIGVLIMAIPASAVAWFALLAITFRSVFHNFLGLFGSLVGAAMVVDTGDPDAWIGHGPGLLLSIVSGIVLGIVAVLHFKPLAGLVWDRADFSATILTAGILVLLLAFSQNTWITAEIVGHNVRLRIQGDQIFGSAIVDGILLATLGLLVLSLLVKSATLTKMVRLTTALVATLRLLQCGFVFAISSLARNVAPSSLPIGDSIERAPSLYFASVLSVISVPLAFSGLFPPRRRRALWYSATTLLLIVGCLTGFGVI